MNRTTLSSRWAFSSIALSAFLCLALARPTSGCICAPPTLEEQIARSQAIFVGRPREARTKTYQPIDRDHERYYTEVVFRVETAWKEMEGNVATIITPLSGGSCGYWPNQFDPDSLYLMYTDEYQDDYWFKSAPPGTFEGRYLTVTSICQRNAVLEGPILEDQRKRVDFRSPEMGWEDLAALGPGIQPRPTGDLNGDRRRSLEDVIFSLRAVVGLALLTTEQRIAGDMNLDDRLTLADPLLLLREIVE